MTSLGLTVAQFVASSGVGRSKTYELINSGKLRAKKFGRRTIILSDSAQALIDGLPDYLETGKLDVAKKARKAPRSARVGNRMRPKPETERPFESCPTLPYLMRPMLARGRTGLSGLPRGPSRLE
jgi:hypothetical protein